MGKILRRRMHLWRQFIEPHPTVRDPDRRSAVRLLAAFMLGLSFLALLICVAYFVVFREFLPILWISFALYPLVYLLSRSSRPRLAEFLLVAGLTGILTITIIAYGPLDFIVLWFLAPILLGAILLPMRAAATLAALNVMIALVAMLTIPPLAADAAFSVTAALIFTAIISLATKHARHLDRQTVEKQALALEQSRARYKELFDDMPIGLFESTADGRLLQANPAMAKMLRFPDLAALKATSAVNHYAHPEARKKWISLVGEKGVLEDYELRIIRADGKQIWVRENVQAVRDGNGEISHFRGSIQDVTERKRLEEKLAEQHQTLQMIVGAMPNILIVVGAGNLVEDVFLPPDFPLHLKRRWRASNARLREVLPQDLAAEIIAALETVRENGEIQTFEHALSPAETDLINWLRIKLSRVRNSDRVIIVLDDITELKEAEAAIRTYARELEKRNEELDAFSHTVAHDLRRPLSHVVGYAGLIEQLADDGTPAEMVECANRIDSAAMNMSEMIEGLLLLAQMRNVDQIIEPTDVSASLEEAIERIKPDIDARGVHLDVRKPIPDALAYGPWLEEVFANLVSNAVQYIGKSNPDPRITIRAKAGQNCIIYKVVDNGLGIEKEDQTRLFDMLSRFHKEESSGTGLGLAIVQRIIEKLSGEVGVESQPGQGSTFWFTLPATNNNHPPP